MKKIIQLVSFISLIVLFFACTNNTANNPDEIKRDTSKKAPSTITSVTNNTTRDCDYYVDKGEADIMIDKYNSDFDKSGLTKQFWIEACALKSIQNFLNDPKNSGYDGVRFILGGKKDLFSTSSILLVVPTTPVVPATSAEKHTDQFGVDIPLVSCNPSQLKMNLNFDDANDKINLFGKKFRNESIEGERRSAKRDPLSIGIWFSECKINELMKLYAPPTNLDGVMAIAAAYYQDDDRRKNGDRKYVVQSTLIFVPTINKVPQWIVVKPPIGWKDNGGFNHGELCPQICN